MPEIIAALGWTDEVVIEDGDYGHLFVLSLGLQGLRLLRLRFGN